MAYGNIPKETLAELLLFINEREELESIRELGTVSREDFRVALNELALQLKVEAADSVQSLDLSQLRELDEPYRKILSALNERESKLLKKGFLG